MKTRRKHKRPKFWYHAKYRKIPFTGHYAKFRGERQFILSAVLRKKNIALESHEAAKKLGWVHR